MDKDRIVIIGAGLQGLTTANALLDRGEEVLLLERSSGVGEGASFANAGMLTPSQANPWNSFSDIIRIISGIGRKGSPMSLKLNQLPSLFSWGLRFLANSTKSRYLSSTNNVCKLAQHSLELTKSIREQHNLNYDHSSVGTMKIFREEGNFDKANKESLRLSEIGLPFKSLNIKEVLSTEPLLSDISEKIVGGILYPKDEIGDAYKFCKEMEELVRNKGGRIHLNTEIKKLLFNKNKVNSVITDRVEIKAARVILTTGPWAGELLKNTKLRPPIRPVKGYSLTLDSSSLKDKPRMPIGDESIHTVITPLGYSLRIAGTAEFAGFSEEIHQKRIDYLNSTLESIYPSIYSELPVDEGSLWYGFRPTSSDGMPLIGGTKIDGLYLNVGHGHLGWTLAMGSADLLADIVLKKEPELDKTPFLPSRFF